MRLRCDVVNPFATSRLYFVAGAQLRAGLMADLVPELVAAGVDVIQLREKELDGGQVLELAEPIAAACRSAGVPFVINDRPDIALALGCHVHLGQDDVPASLSRQISPASAIGRSTHSVEQVDAEVAADPRPDCIAVGPVFATPTKPGRPSTGLDLIRHAAKVADPIPWFAIGGISEDTLDDVMEAGAKRIVVLRAIAEAADPAAVAGRLRARLEQVAL